MISIPHKNTLLQVTQGNALTKTCKRVFLFTTQEKFKNKKTHASQKLNLATTQPTATQFDNDDKPFTDLCFDSSGERTTGYNSTYKKLAVQWLNEALCFVSSSVLADSLVLRNRQLLVAAKRYKQVRGKNKI